MGDIGVNIGIKIVLARCDIISESSGFFVYQLDEYNRFDTFISIFPWGNQANGSPMLKGQFVAVDTGRQQR